MSKPSAAERTGTGRPGRRRAARPAVIWGVIGLVSYGLTLTLISDTFFWFAIPDGGFSWTPAKCRGRLRC